MPPQKVKLKQTKCYGWHHRHMTTAALHAWSDQSIYALSVLSVVLVHEAKQAPEYNVG